MKIPDSIRINGIDYKITYTPALNDEQQLLYGRINYETSIIELNPERQAHQHMCITLWHEILHGIENAMQLSGKLGDDEELIVDTFAKGVYQVLQDNGRKLFDMDAKRNEGNERMAIDEQR